MFEKIKQKSKEAKNWVVDHKSEIVIGALGVAVGVLGAALVEKRNNERPIGKLDEYMDAYNSGENLLFDVIRAERQADHMYWNSGDDGPTLSGLGDILVEQAGDDEQVIAALIYTKEIK